MATSTHTSALELSFVTDCPTVRPPANDVICYNTVKYGTKKSGFGFPHESTEQGVARPGGGLAHVSPRDPRIVHLGDVQRHEAMHRPPGDLGHLVGVGELGAQATGGDRIRAGLPQEPVGILSRIGLPGALWAPIGPARHEQELVVHRVSHTEGDVGAARPAKSLDGVSYGAEVLQRLGEGPEVEGGELGHERFLVLEMVVDGSRGVADFRGDGAHRRGFVSALHKHASSRVENLLPRLDALALPALEAGNGLGHNLVISYNGVTFVSRDETRSHDDLGDDDNPECARRTRCGVLHGRGAPGRSRGTGPPRLGAGYSHPLCRGGWNERPL